MLTHLELPAFRNKKKPNRTVDPLLGRPLRLCLVAPQFQIVTGNQGLLRPIARGLAKRGHEVTILSRPHPQKLEVLEVEGVRVEFMPERHRASRGARAFPEWLYNRFVQLHVQTPFDLIHSVDDSALNVARKRRLLGVGAAFDVEATGLAELMTTWSLAQETTRSLLATTARLILQFERSYWGHDRALLKCADAMFVSSPQQQLALERYYLYPEARTHMVPYGLEIGDLRPKERSLELRSKLQLSARSQVVLTVSDFNRLDETLNLLKAFERLVVKKPAARLVVLGDGPKRRDLERAILDLALGRFVVLAGKVEAVELGDYLSLADAYVNLSSRGSGFEFSTLEAMSQKKVVIGSEMSPLEGIIEDGKDGFLLRPADIPGLAALLVQVFEGQLAVDTIGENARFKILDIFDTNRMVDQTLRAYASILPHSVRLRSTT